MRPCSKKKLCAIYGKWTECLYTVDAATFDAHKKSDKRNSEEKKSSKQVTCADGVPTGLAGTSRCTLACTLEQGSVDEEPEEMPPPNAETVQVIPGSELIWKITPRPHNSSQVRKGPREWKVVQFIFQTESIYPRRPLGLLPHRRRVCLSASSMRSPHSLCT